MEHIQELMLEDEPSVIPHINEDDELSDITESDLSSTDASDDEFLQGTTKEYRKNNSKLKEIENYFNNQYLQALQDIDEALSYEETVEGSRYRVHNLFKNHEKVHRENPLKLEQVNRLSKNKLNIKKLQKKKLEAKDEVDSVLLVDDDVLVIDKIPKDISKFEKKLEEYYEFKNETVNSVYKISENFQQLYSQFETELNKKRPETIRLEEQVEKMDQHIQRVQRVAKEKEHFHQEALQEVDALKIQVQQVKRAYLSEYKSKERLQKLAKKGNLLNDYIAYVGRKKKKKKFKLKTKRIQRNEGKKIIRTQIQKIKDFLKPYGHQGVIKQLENIELEDSGSSGSSGSESEEDKDIALILAEETAHQQMAMNNLKNEEEEEGENGVLTMEEVMALDPENAITKKDMDETYVRFVDGFSQKVEFYESEKAVKDRLIEEMKIQMHEQQEEESKVIQRLKQNILSKEEELQQEKEKYRKIFIAQLTRQHTIQQEFQSNTASSKKKKKKSKKHDKPPPKEREKDTSGEDSPATNLNQLNEFDIASLPKSPAEALKELTLKFNSTSLAKTANVNLYGDENSGISEQTHDELKKRLEKSAKKLKLRVDTAIRKKSDLQKRLDAYEVTNKPRNEESHAVPEGRNGPKGRVVLVFTDIQGSTNLWEKSIDAMVESINLHNEVIRMILRETGGYEVKTEGDAFMCAFSSSFDAVEFAMRVQIELLKIDWPEEVYTTKFASIEKNKMGDIIWRGIRVRIGMHIGEPLIMKDPTTHRLDYFGPVVNKAARVEGCADGGEVCVSSDVWNDIEEHLNPEISKFTYLPMVRKKLSVQLKGIDGNEVVRSLLPVKLKDRKFPKKNKESKSHSKTIKKLKQKVRELENEVKQGTKDININNIRKKLVDKEEMIQYLSTMVLLQNQNIEKLQKKVQEPAVEAITKSKTSKSSTDSNANSDSEHEESSKPSTTERSHSPSLKHDTHSFKKHGSLKNSITKSKYRETNHKLNMMTRQRDEAVSKAEDLQRTLLKTEEKLSSLRATMQSYKKEYSIKLKHVKRETRYLRRKRRQDTKAAKVEARNKTLLEMEQRLPSLSRSHSRNAISPARSSQRDRSPRKSPRKKKKRKKSKVPRYMQSLKRTIKPISAPSNPNWITTD